MGNGNLFHFGCPSGTAMASASSSFASSSLCASATLVSPVAFCRRVSIFSADVTREVFLLFWRLQYSIDAAAFSTMDLVAKFSRSKSLHCSYELYIRFTLNKHHFGVIVIGEIHN